MALIDLFVSLGGVLSALLVRELGEKYRDVYIILFFVFGVQSSIGLGRVGSTYDINMVWAVRGTLFLIVFFLITDLIINKKRK